MMQRSHRLLAALLSAAVLVCSAGSGALAATFQDSQDAAMREYLAANGLLNRGHYELAAGEYEKFLKRHADHNRATHARYGLSVAYVRLGRHEDAVKVLEMIEDVRDFEFAAEVGVLLGQSRMSLGQFAEAAAPLEQVMRRHTEHDLADDAAALLVETRYRAGAHDEIDDPGEMLVERWPDSPLRERAELFWGLSKVAVDRHGEAVPHFEWILSRGSEGEFADQASLLVARSYQELDNLDAAKRHYAAVIRSANESLAPDALYQLAGILRREGKAREAIQLLDKLLEMDAADELTPLAHQERGRALFDMNQFEDALASFKAASEAGETIDDQAEYWMAKSEMRLDRYDAAAKRLARATEKFPESPLLPEVRYDRAIALLRAEHPEDAILALANYRAAHPDHEMAAEALRLMANVAHQLEHYGQSEQFCETFREEYPEDENLAEIAFLNAENAFLPENYEDATERYGEFLEQWPDHAQAKPAHYRLGSALYRLDRPEEAAQYLAQVTSGAETETDYRPALRMLGDIAFAAADWSDAEHHYEHYLSFGDAQANADDALLKLGLARHRQKDYDGALAAYEQLIDTFDESPHHLQARFERGQALVMLDRTEEATAALEALVTDTPDSRFAPYAINHLATVAMRAEDFERAAEYYRKVADSDVDDEMAGEALFQRGQALMALEQYEDASATFDELIEDHPSHERASLARANAALAVARVDHHEDAIRAIDGVIAASDQSIGSDLLITLAYEKAWAQRELDQNEQAKETYRALLDAPAASGSRGEELVRYARLELAELEASDEEHETVVKLLSDQPEFDRMPAEFQSRALYRLGASLYELDRFDEAGKTFERFLAVEGDDEELTNSGALLAGESNFRLQKYERAVEQLGLVVHESDDASLRAPALLRLGESFAALQRWSESEESFRVHLADYEDSPLWFQARFGLGFALENQGRYDDAIACYREVVDRHQGATTARAQFQIGECLFAQNLYDDAVREFLKVDILYAYPEWSAAALYEAGRCFESMAQIAEARKYFQQVRDQHGDTRWAALAEERLAALAEPNLPGRGGR